MEMLKDSTTGLFDKLNSGKEYYEIRLESIGGLGANLCAKMLGEMGVKYLELNSSSFSSYGSEKSGTPVKGFIRYCKKEKEIRVHYPVVCPDLLVVFHQALLKDKTIFKGCNENTTVVIAVDREEGQENKETDFEAINYIKKYCKTDKCFCVQAQRIAMETHSRINVVMLGAAIKVMGMEDTSIADKICEEMLGKKYPAALKSNLEGIRRGYEEVREINNLKGYTQNKSKVENDNNNEKQRWGYDNAPIGGINQRIGSTVIADLSPSRQGYIPLFIKEKCINCGLCHSTCPDMVFQFVKGEYKGREMMVNQGLDYYHCKGCLRCVDICPVNALVRGVEGEHTVKEHLVVNKELLRKPDYYEESGADGYITSESYLTEKRMEGGEV